MKTRIAYIILFGLALLLSRGITAQVVIYQQGFDSTSGSHDDGTWTNVNQIQNGGNAWSEQSGATANEIIEGNYSCSGWSHCYDKTGNTYGITGGCPTFKGTGTNIGYTSTNSTYFAIFNDYDVPSTDYGGIYTTTFNLSNYNNANLTFYWNNANTDDSYIQVQYWNGSEWTGATDFGEGTGSLGWHEATMSLPSTATELVFFVVSDYYYYAIGIDGIEIYATPNCTLSASISSHTNVSPCSTSTNGAATVTASGGTTPYTYSWTPSSGLTGATTASAGNMGEGTYTCTVTDHAGCVVTPTVTIGGPTAVTGSVTSQTNISCYGGNNGSATISASGGTSPYTYSWSSGEGTNTTASNLTAGTYTCTITDHNSCTGTVVVTITQPSALRDSISASTNVSCHGGSTGSATAGVKNGTSPYTYSWAPSGGTNATASSLAAGTYTVTVTDAHSCTGTATVTITQPSALRDSISASTNVTCNGDLNGSATVGVKGGASPYTYSWNSSPAQTTATATGLGAGSYTVTVTDNKGCTGTATVTITQPAEFEGTYTPYNSCGPDNGAIAIHLSGGTQPYTYTWTPNVGTTDSVYGLAAGTYSISANDANGCGPLTVRGGIAISQITAETVSITSSTNVACYGGSTGSATASASPTQAYKWEPGGSTSATISSLSAGIYTVVATETDECTATATVDITQPATALRDSISSSTNVTTCGTNTNGAATIGVKGGTSPYTYSWAPSAGLTGATTASAGNMGEGTYTSTVTDAKGCTGTATVTITGPTDVTGSVTSQTNVSCNGGNNGAATISASGGTSPYTYSWSSGEGTNATASNLSAGTYTCTITDHNSCTGTVVVTITQPSALRDSISASTNVSCNGGSTGSATVGVKNGTSPYTYSWSPSGGTNATASNLAAGTYTCTITDAHGCTSTVAATITQSSAIRDSISSLTNEPCNGDDDGSATVGVKGGTSPYTYSWAPGGGTHATASDLYANTYTVTITDNKGCTSTAVATITQPAVFTGSLNTYNICGSGTGEIGVDLTGGTPPYTYSWTPNITTTDTTYGLASGSSYTISVNDANNCGPLDAHTTIETITAETVTVTSSTNESCYGGSTGSATASASPTHAYVWEPGGSTNATINNLTAGIYTVVATETDECTATATVNITQPTAITPTISYTNTCSGSTNGSASVSVSGGTSPYTYSWSTSPAQTTTSISSLAAGNYTVTVTDHNSCVATATVSIGTNATPTVSITPSSASICTGSSTSLTASGATTYTWAPSTGLSPTTGTAVTANPTSTITYTITGTASGCSGTQTVTVTVNSVPTLTVTPSAPSICAGSSTSLTASGASTYIWSPNTNLSATTGATVTANPSTSTTYTVTGTNSNGCVNTQTVAVTVNPLPTLTITPSSASICAGSSTSLTASGASTYTWAPNTNLSATTGTTVSANPTSSTTYTVTGTNSNGCVNTQTIAVTVNPLPTLTITPSSASICAGSSTSLTASGASTYTWAPNTDLSATTGATVTANPSTSTTYTVTGTNSNGCINTQTVIVDVNPVPTITVTPAATSICTGSSTSLTASGANTYIWSPNTNLSATTGATVSANPTSTTTYTVTGTNSNGCANTQMVTITVNPLPTLTITPSSSIICNGGSTSLTASGASTYTWAPSTNLSATTGTTVSANPTSSTTYTVTGTNSSGCVNTQTVSVTVNATVTVSIGQVMNVKCNGGDNGQASAGVQGGTSPYTYSWNTSPVQTNSTATNLTAGGYTVTITDANGCTGTATVSITQPPALRDSISASTNITCYGANNGSATVGVKNGTSPYTYSWNTSPVQTNATATNLAAGSYTVTVTDANSCNITATVTITQPPALRDSISAQTNIDCSQSAGSATVGVKNGTSPYTYSWNTSPVQTNGTATGLSAGSYTVTVTDANGCSNTATATITQLSTLSASATSTSACMPGLGSATASASGGTSPYTYSWSPGGNTNSTVTDLSGGTYTVTVTDANGCIATASATVYIYNVPSVVVSPTAATIAPPQNVSISAFGSGGSSPYSFTWSPSTGLNSTSGATVIASPTVTTTYTVTINDMFGVCSSTATSVVTVTPATTTQTPTSCDTCIGGLNLQPGKTYLASVWVKDHTANPTDTTYLNPELTILFPSTDTTYGPFFGQGRIIDGWQRIEAQFKVPVTATSFNIQLSCASGQCNFDDIRVFPFNGTLKTYVYDPNTLRLMAVLDERNYATIYEYDEEGKLIRVKKETEREVMTIQESRTSMQKKQ
ncbi:MAG: hypothetical protein ACLQQ4_17325 [Bacteroidia bacterium]